MENQVPSRITQALSELSMDDGEFLNQVAEPHSNNGLKPAAVLAPFYWDGREWRVLFTKRTDKVDSHKGQISFPGGARDPDDESYAQTALRETWEEIGVRTADVKLLGRLRPIVTITGYRVFPFVGIIPHPYEFKLAPFEVASLLELPLAQLLEEAKGQDPTNPLGLTFNQGGDVVWGATARMMYELIQTVFPEYAV